MSDRIENINTEGSGARIVSVAPDSIAEELELEAGDILLAVNDQPLRDIIDYGYFSNEEFLRLSVLKPDGELWDCEVEKYPDEDLGLSFDAEVFDGIRRCRNHCLFCFVDQLQPHPRPTLRLKDDDYRMSFLEGNYITCTNMTDADYHRIGEQRLSPLYISVHSVDPQLRQRLLGTKEPAEILLTLQRLIAQGCSLHTQIVVCPGINDGRELDRTLDALTALRPGVLSVAVVPVGLTKFQKNPELRRFTQEEAAAIIDGIEQRQDQLIGMGAGDHFVYAADELYIQAGRPFPPAAAYGDFCQIENGVGLAARFIAEYEEAASRLVWPAPAPDGSVGVVTGMAGAKALSPIIRDLHQRGHTNIELLPIANTFFGDSVTVTGLLTGSCLLEAIEPGRYDRLLLPSITLKFDQDIFLDEIDPEQVADKLRARLDIVSPDAVSLLQALLGPVKFKDGSARKDKPCQNR